MVVVCQGMMNPEHLFIVLFLFIFPLLYFLVSPVVAWAVAAECAGVEVWEGGEGGVVVVVVIMMIIMIMIMIMTTNNNHNNNCSAP